MTKSFTPDEAAMGVNVIKAGSAWSRRPWLWQVYCCFCVSGLSWERLLDSLYLTRTTSSSNPTSPVTRYQRERHSSPAAVSPSFFSIFSVFIHHVGSFFVPSFCPLFPRFSHSPYSYLCLFPSSLNILPLPAASRPTALHLALQT